MMIYGKNAILTHAHSVRMLNYCDVMIITTLLQFFIHSFLHHFSELAFCEHFMLLYKYLELFMFLLLSVKTFRGKKCVIIQLRDQLYTKGM